MGFTFLLHRPGGSLLLISLAVFLCSSELSLEIFSQHVCLLSCALSTPDPREFLDLIILSHLLHRPACISTPAPLENKDRGQNRTGQEGTAGQDGVEISSGGGNFLNHRGPSHHACLILSTSSFMSCHSVVFVITFSRWSHMIIPTPSLIDVITRLFGLPL